MADVTRGRAEPAPSHAGFDADMLVDWLPSTACSGVEGVTASLGVGVGVGVAVGVGSSDGTTTSLGVGVGVGVAVGVGVGVGVAVGVGVGVESSDGTTTSLGVGVGVVGCATEQDASTQKVLVLLFREPLACHSKR